MIKEVKPEETPFCTNTRKFDIFAEDLKRIIDQRMEYCELIDMPYSDTTSTADLAYKARKVCRRLIWDMGIEPVRTDYFEFARSVKDGKVHFFVKFNVKLWEATV